MVGNNYGLGETRKTELMGACNTLGITRKDRCVVLDHKYPTPSQRVLQGRVQCADRYSKGSRQMLMVGNYRTIRMCGGIRI